MEKFDECVQIESIIVMRLKLERQREMIIHDFMIPSTGCTFLHLDYWHSQLALENIREHNHVYDLPYK